MGVAVATRAEVEVGDLSLGVYTVPTDEPESDGTLEWDSLTMVVVEAEAGGETGLGYTYGDASVARFVESKLADEVRGRTHWLPRPRGPPCSGRSATRGAPAWARWRSPPWTWRCGT